MQYVAIGHPERSGANSAAAPEGDSGSEVLVGWLSHLSSLASFACPVFGVQSLLLNKGEKRMHILNCTEVAQRPTRGLQRMPDGPAEAHRRWAFDTLLGETQYADCTISMGRGYPKGTGK
jgi:hypothetical protein